MQIILVLTILGAAVLFLVTEWIEMEVVALLVLGCVALTGLVGPTEALSGFSNPAVVTIWAIFIQLVPMISNVGNPIPRSEERRGHLFSQIGTCNGIDFA